MDRDFFRACFDLKGLSNVQLDFRGRLEKHLGSSDILGEGMEEAFSTVFLDLMRAPKRRIESPAALREHPNGLFVDLVMGLLAVLAATTNPLAGDARAGAMLRVFRELHSRGRELVVVSFNYDLVAEAALDALAAEGRAKWSLPTTYGASFHRAVATDRGGGAEARFCTTIEPTESLRLLKLHGSANWVTLVPFGNVRLDSGTHQILSSVEASEEYLHDFARHFRFPADRRVLCVTNRLLPTVPEFTHDEEGAVVKNWPLVVPPVTEKGEFLMGWLAPVWNEAIQALRAADHVVFWGYSLPPADHGAAAMLRRALAERRPAPRVSVINPDSAVGGHLLSRLRLQRIEQFLGEEEFLAAGDVGM